MQWIEAAFRSSPGDIDALCERLTALGAEGLVIEDEADFRRFLEQNRQYWDYVDEELESRYRGVSRVKLYVEDTPEGRAQLAAFTDGTGLEPECRTVADEDWAESWKQYYKPIEIGERLLILPSWEPIPKAPERLVLRLDPGLAFGTGGHETTSLCMEALDERVTGGERVLDIGTGSGAIAVSLAKLGRPAQVTAVDVSDRALEIARQNAERNGAAVEFVKSDCFSALKGRKYDMIVSNPPYISEDEMRGLMPEVTREPELALFGGADGLDFYRRISREAPEYLNEGGCLLFEIGWLQKDAVSALVKAHIGEPFALRDYGQNWRVVGAKKEGAC